MDRPVRNKKSVNYSQFLDLENDDEDFTPSVPVSKKCRVETKKEKKDTKKAKEETSSPKNSQGKRLPLDEKIYQRDLEVALTLSAQETSVIVENENPPRTGMLTLVSPSFCPSESKDPEVSFSNCSVDSSVLGLDEITESNEELVGKSRRQAASKAITQQRKLLKDDSNGEEDADEFKPDTAVYGDSDSGESYSDDDDDDEEFEAKKSKKAASKVPKAKNEKKGEKIPKAQRKNGDSESDSSFSGDEEFEVKKSKKIAASKCPKAKHAKKENNTPPSKATSISSAAPVSIKIKPMTAKHTTALSPVLTKPAGQSSLPVGMKRPAWSPPASSGAVRSPLNRITVQSPNQGLRLGLSRLARVKPLHPASVLL